MKSKKVNNAIFCIVTVLVMVISLILIAVFSGFKHETKKFKTLVVTIVMVLLFQFLICDLIKFAVLGIDAATWPKKQGQFATESDGVQFSRLDYLKLRLRSLRSQLLITEEHRNEQLNEKYHHIAKDLWLYGTYFFLLLLLVLVHQDITLYYNTNQMERLFRYNQTDTMGLRELFFICQTYDFIELTLIKSFHVNVSETHHDGWKQIEQMKMLGVVRLRQLRLKELHMGTGRPTWTSQTYLPEWQLPYRRLHYTEKFWRIYEPWQPIFHTPSIFNGLLLDFDHIGYFQHYPELVGYVALLTSNMANSMKVLEFLKEYNWLSHNTSAIFMDFTMYNADANVFTVCTMRIENTPYGIEISEVQVESAKLLESLDQQSHLGLIILMLYLLVVIQFSRYLLVKLWYDPREIRSIWNKVDLVICLLNAFLVLLTVLREAEVSKLLRLVESSTKSEFLDFQRPTRLYLLNNILLGFLICLATLRLWKVLQFASVFQVFTQTLYLAWPAVASTGIIIIVFLVAFGISVVIINGNNSLSFHHLLKSIVTCMCFAMGFTSHVKPKDMFFGGEFLGIIIYLILVFIVAVVLINVFASIIYAYFESAEQTRRENKSRHINFIQFLRVEYSDLLQCCLRCRCLRKNYHKNNRTVSQNIDQELDERENSENQNRVHMEKKIDDFVQSRDYKRRMERSYVLVAIMRVQIEFLERILFGDKDGNLLPLSDSDYTSDSDIPDMYRKKKVSKY